MRLLTICVLAAVLVGACKSKKDQDNQNIMNTDTNNEILANILSRTSIRNYSDREISVEDMNKLLKAAMSAPSSKDRRPWHFVAISDKTILSSLGERLKNASCLNGANKAVVVCGDVELSDNCWFLDCSAATQNILLAAHSIGIGAVWTAAYPYEDRMAVISEILELPENIKALAVIPMGYPTEENKAKDKFDETRIHLDRW
ncbi:MAG: nitroreductase family protein [Prevotellaceae bacterium]|jgi:nitroreductase|nr:nitroreductase family protein [Prevotellaceae bacterium]